MVGEDAYSCLEPYRSDDGHQFGREQMKDTKPLTTGNRQGGGLCRHKSEDIS